jgi:branched-subunit amino acid transport protein
VNLAPAALWAVILAIGLGTFLLRLSFVQGLGAREPSATFSRLLRHVPAAVLCALVLPAILVAHGEAAAPAGHARALAAGVAFLVAIRTRNMALTILTGMVSLWLIRAAL